MGRVTIELVEVSAQDVAKIPRSNIRVPRDEFVAVWRFGERLGVEIARSQSHDWYTAGVVATCRWLANATVRPSGGGSWYVAYAPATDRSVRAEPETIGPEVLAAEKLAFRRPIPSWLADRPGWAEGILTTFAWAWRGSARPPLDFRQAASG